MKSEVQRIASLLKRSFEKNAWYGPSVKEVLEGITPEQACHRAANTHSIIELVAHMTSWREFVLSRINGPFDFTVTEENNFPKIDDWNAALSNLEKSQHALITALESFTPEKLEELVPHGSHKYTYYTLLHGIIHHDIYHTGQISLLKKSLT